MIEEWQIKLMEREIFGTKHPEMPWLLHTVLEPAIKVHLVNPEGRPKTQDGNYLCQCDKPIPEGVMRQYFFLKSTCKP